MKKTIFVLSILLVAVSSCVTSLQPLVTYNTAIADTRLEGTWQQDDQEYIVQKAFDSDFYKKNKKDLEKSRKENNGQLSEKDKKDSILLSKSYMIMYTKNGIQYLLFGSMIKLNNRVFMNFTPVDITSTDSTNKEAEINQIELSDTNAWFEVTLYEGRNQQIRKMFKSIGHSVLKLKRVAIGFLNSDRLPSGEVRALTDAEVKRFFKMKDSAPVKAAVRRAPLKVAGKAAKRPARKGKH